MKKAIKLFGALMCVFAVAQFSQPAMAQTYVRHYTLHVAATAGTTVITASTVYVSTLVIAVSTVGTNPIQITNTAGEVKWQAASTALGTITTFTSSKNDSVQVVGLKLVAPATAVFDVTMVYYL